MSDEFVLTLSLVESRPVYEPDKGGNPLFVGFQVSFEPVLLSAEELRRLDLSRPYRLQFVPVKAGE